MALLGGTGTPTVSLSRRLVAQSFDGADAGGVRQPIAPHVQRHHDLFERRVAGTLADAVDRALDLARAGLDRGQRVGDRQPEIVVAVRRQDDAVADPGAHGANMCVMSVGSA